MEDPQGLAVSLACSIFEKELNMRKAFSRYDKNSDGTIDRDEFAEVMNSCMSPGNAAAMDEVFGLFDSDGNGRLSIQEFTDALLDFGGNLPSHTFVDLVVWFRFL
jgi:Ca2+-binding EF-hand superfamily protein